MKIKKNIEKDIPKSNISFDSIKNEIDYENISISKAKNKKTKLAIIIASSTLILCCIISIPLAMNLLGHAGVSDSEPLKIEYGTYSINSSFSNEVLYFTDECELVISDKENNSDDFNFINNTEVYYLRFYHSNMNEWKLNNYNFNYSNLLFKFSLDVNQYSCLITSSDENDIKKLNLIIYDQESLEIANLDFAKE